jgi:hypothetical protein
MGKAIFYSLMPAPSETYLLQERMAIPQNPSITDRMGLAYKKRDFVGEQ